MDDSEIVEIMARVDCDTTPPMSVPFDEQPDYVQRRFRADAMRQLAALRAAGLDIVQSWSSDMSKAKTGANVWLWVPEIGEPILARWSPMFEELSAKEIERLEREVNTKFSDDDLHEPDWWFADFAHGARLTDGTPVAWAPVLPRPTGEVSDG